MAHRRATLYEAVIIGLSLPVKFATQKVVRPAEILT
jgi:hypothetical protein